MAPAFSLSTGNNQVVAFGGGDAVPTLLVFFKHDCATCDLTLPLVERLHTALSAEGLRVVGISQDAVAHTSDVVARHHLSFTVALDGDLEVSADYGFDAVPALVLVGPDRAVVASFEGFTRPDLLTLTERTAAACGAAAPRLVHDGDGLPEHRPGCGSKVHDPDVARRLVVRRGAATLGARRVQVPIDDDPFDFLSAQGLDDGLPVVPPTEARVLRMLDGTQRAACDRSRLHGPVQSSRCAGHNLLCGSGHCCQRPNSTSHRPQLRRQPLRAGLPRQRHDWTCPAARGPQHRRWQTRRR